MSTLVPCPACGCAMAHAAHAVVAALQVDDVDRAFASGLMEVSPCPTCSAECTQRLLQARTERERALAARERYRARQARLEARVLARAKARAVPVPVAGDAPAPKLPSAAAAALARAKARAAQRHKP